LLTDNSKSVLKHLNQVSGSRFQNCSASLDNIRARLREGFTPEELMLVVDYKHEHWNGTKDYQYMRPKTLFIPGNFQAIYRLQPAGKRAVNQPVTNGMSYALRRVPAYLSSHSRTKNMKSLEIPVSVYLEAINEL
jgi:uncharacterized phage protein (TIGR02220 family)